MTDSLEVFILARRVGSGGRLLSGTIVAYLCHENRIVTGRIWRTGKRWQIGGFNRWLAGDLYSEILRCAVQRAEIGERRISRRW